MNVPLPALSLPGQLNQRVGGGAAGVLPVHALKKVLLPALGFPTSPTT